MKTEGFSFLLVNLFFCKEKVVAELKGRADAGVVNLVQRIKQISSGFYSLTPIVKTTFYDVNLRI